MTGKLDNDLPPRPFGGPLSEQDYEDLRTKSFISREIADQAGLFRVSDADGAEIVGRKRNANASYEGIAAPFRLPGDNTTVREYQLRLDHPDYEVNDKGELRPKGKYLMPPETRNMLYFPPGVREQMLKDPTLPIALFEGIKKALAALRVARHDQSEGRLRFIPVALIGVWNAEGVIGKTTDSKGARVSVKGEIPDLDLIEWKGRIVYISFDSNVFTNPSVSAARRRLARILKKRGAKLLYADLPEDCGVNGFDDYLGKIAAKEGEEAAVRAGLEIFARARKPSSDDRSTPKNFLLIEDGPTPGLNYVNEDGERSWICSSFQVTAMTFTESGENYGRLGEWTDSEGRSKKWSIPIAMIHGDSTEVFRHLSSEGLLIDTSRKSLERLRAYINLAQPDKKILCTARLGWNGDTYVLPDEAFGPKSNMVYQPSGKRGHKFNQKGSLEEWKAEIARYCEGNSRLAFAVSMAFAGPLLPIMNVQGGGINFYGPSSIGKTTAALVAGSVFGGSDAPLGYAETWRVTDNGLEALCEMYNNGLLVLDEVSQCDPNRIGEIEYMIANGHGKGRMSRAGGARDTSTWTVMCISTGEKPLERVIRETGQRVNGGQLARVCDIPADTGKHGILDTLHGFESGQALADHFRSATRSYYGTAIRAFLRAITRSPREPLVTAWDAFLARFEGEILKLQKDESSEVRRVARRFAAIAFAGEIATQEELTGWERGEATRSAGGLFQTWRRARIGPQAADLENGILQVKHFLEKHGQSRFQSHYHETSLAQEVRPYPEKIINRAGFKKRISDEETLFLIFHEVFRNEVCEGYDPTAIARDLRGRGVLETDKGILQKTVRLPELGPTKVYAVSSKLFGDGEEHPEQHAKAAAVGTD